MMSKLMTMREIMPRQRWILGLLLCVLAIVPVQAQAQDDAIQDITDLVQMNVEAGYDAFFRADYWFPLRIQVENNRGSDIQGRLIVRPESSGRILNNAYSTPIDLPDGSAKAAFLYVQAADAQGSLVVELLTDDNNRVVSRNARVTNLNPEDNLYITVSSTGANTLALSGATPAGTQAGQARWTPDNVPDRAAALYAVDALIFYDVNSDDLTAAQRQALRDYVTVGGHLIVVGGTDWRTTSAAFAELLPLVPDDNITLDGVPELAQFIGVELASLEARTIAATGTLQENATVLIHADDDDETPLLARRELGAGTVDFLAVDPGQEPLASWENLPEWWLHLLETPDPQPGWQRGFLESQDAARAIAILPDVDLLPPVSSMLAYILAYVLLIGPVNYLVLSRINRTEWAWLTIPLFIGIFTLLAWTVGFNLRGQEIIVSRLQVTQSWADDDTARVDQLLGVLSPRRDTYELSVDEAYLLRTMPELASGGFLQRNVTQSSAEIVQSGNFSAENITIDGGIFANFSTTGTAEKPAIGGSITFSPGSSDDSLQGVARNDSDLTLDNAAILTRNQMYYFEEPFAPGDVVPFSSRDMETPPVRVPEDRYAAPSPLQSIADFTLQNTFRSRGEVFSSLTSARFVLGDLAEFSGDVIEYEDETQIRQQAFLGSFMRNEFGAPGMGREAYLVGWTTIPDDDITLSDSNIRFVDTGLVIAQLDSTVEMPDAGETASITPENYTWTILQRNEAEGGLTDLTLINGGSAVVRFMPLDSARLESVEALTIEIDRSSSYGRNVELALWDWNARAWEVFDNVAEIYELDAAEDDNVSRFIGPNNMVDVRVRLALETGLARLDGIRITQTGTY